MLLLRRKRGECIVIGEDAKVIIKVVKSEDDVITIGIDAPRHLLVDRLEVFEDRQTLKS